MNTAPNSSSRTTGFHNTIASNGWESWSLTPVETAIVSHATATDAILSTETPPSFSEWDQSNGVMKEWLEWASVGSKCSYMSHQFEVIQSWSEKLLMLLEIIPKSGTNFNRKNSTNFNSLTFQQWIDTISDTMRVPWLQVMSKTQMDPIKGNKEIFPDEDNYVSSLLDQNIFWAWAPASRYWINCTASVAYCSNVGSYPWTIRCILELS